jgi:DNA invertase Pin-like site-specific DNA recombinase
MVVVPFHGATSKTVMPKTIFYCRTSTGSQRLDLQLDAAQRAGVPSKHVYTENACARHDRPKLREALDALQPGDTFMAFKLDRVGRSLMHLTQVLAEIEAKRASFATVEDGLSTKGATGKLVLHVLGAIGEFERSLVIERTQAGLAAARKRGRIGGRKRVMTPEETRRARALMGRADLSANDVAAMMKVSRRSLFRYLRAARDHDELVGARE